MMDTPAADPAKENRLESDMKDALRYLMVVKQHVDADKYQKFGEIMMDLLTERIRPAEGLKIVKDLLQGHPDLFLGFLCFVPKDLDKIDPPPTETKSDYTDAFAFICKVKKRFSENVEKYRSFVNLLYKHLSDRKPPVEVYQEIVVLFQDHADLIKEFTYFMPTASRKVLSQVSSMDPLGHTDQAGPSNKDGVRGSKDKGKEKVIDKREEDK